LSHLHEREEKVCLNCGANLTGRYCQDCGQENVEPKESTWHLIVHFFNDVTHFDGKFFTTMKPLLFKPGFLTDEYVKGRRAGYLNPIRMYLFISAIFFLLLMSVVGDNALIEEKADNQTVTTFKVGSGDDVITFKNSISGKELIDSLKKQNIELSAEEERTIVANSKRTTVHEYDSVQHTLPKNQRDNFIYRHYWRKILAAMEMQRSNTQEFKRRILTNLFHSLPKVLFITLPFFAMMLMLLYIRHRKHYYYVSHVIFTIHIYCFSFILWTIALVLKGVPFVGSTLTTLIPIIIFFYLYKAMRRFYKQRRGITILKFILVYFGIGILVLLVSLGFALNLLLNVASPH
jgi:hypothetical protein